MNLSLQSIEVEAFRNFVKPATVDLSGLPPGLYRVRGRNLASPRRGDNGVGKSTLFSDAPTWCLFGTTVGGLRTTDVRSWYTKHLPRVALSFCCDTREEIVQRGPKATQITINGRAVGQADVEAAVGLGPDAWGQAVVWGQGRPLFFDRTPADKMQLLSDVLGLARWERRSEAASQRARRLEGSLREEQGALSGLGTALERARGSLREAQEAAEVWGQQRAQLRERLAKEAQDKRAQADDLSARAGEAAMSADQAGLVARELRDDVEVLVTKLSETEEGVRQAKRRGDAAVEELGDVEAQLNSFSQTGTCPTCGQPVKKRDADKHVRELRSRAKALGETAAEGSAEAERASVEASGLRDRLVEARRLLGAAERDLEVAAGEQRSLEREFAVAQAEAQAAERARSGAEEETNPHRDAVTSARSHIRDLEKETREREDYARRLEASAERAQFWAKGFREIRLGLVDDLLIDLRETTADLLEDFGLGEWEVDYLTERETRSGTTQRALTVMIRAPGSPESVRWEVYSGGEQQRLRLAGALALSEVLLAHAGVHVDFRVLDEPTRSLSREGVQDLTELLAVYAEQNGVRLFYVDHQVQEGLAFEGAIMVVNEKGGARVAPPSTSV